MMNKFCEGGNLKALTNSEVFGPIYDNGPNLQQGGVTTMLQEARELFRKTFSGEGSSMFWDVMDFHGAKYFSPKRSDLRENPKWHVLPHLMVLLVEYLNHKHPS